MTNWRKSDYPFKSPHWRRFSGHIFNDLCKEVGDPSKVPVRIPNGKNKYEYRDQPKYKIISEQAVEMLNIFMHLSSYTDLALLEKTIPFRYLYILPARQGIIIYSAYSHLISKNPDKPARIEEMQEYIHSPIGKNTRLSDSSFYIHELLRSHFSLFTISKPFRCLLSLPVVVNKKGSKSSKIGERKLKNLEIMQANAAEVMQIIKPRVEWEEVSSPGNIIKNVYQILLKYGSKVALQYIRYIFRLEALIRQELYGKGNFDREQSAKRIIGLTERYLNIEKTIKFVQNSNGLA